VPKHLQDRLRITGSLSARAAQAQERRWSIFRRFSVDRPNGQA
jgi:hypothetical protein